MNRIKELRQKNNLTLKQLGQKLNMLDSTLSQYENEKRNPNQEIWKKLADFFNVSVQYLKGNTLNETELTERLIPLVHKFYFDTWIMNHFELIKKRGGNIQGQHYDDDMLFNDINTYLVFNQAKKMPVDLYQNNEIEFKLNEDVYSYWRKNLKKIILTMVSKEYLKSMNEFILLNEFKTILDERCQEISSNDNSDLTALGFFYKAEFDNDGYSENRMHQNMITAILHGNYQNAKNAINEYLKVIRNLKKQVDKFDATSYFLYRLDNVVLPIQNPFNANPIMNEIYKRVHNGDNKLLNYIMNRDGESLIRVYYDYKKENNEPVDYLYKLQDDFKNKTLKMLKDDKFRSYLSQNYDFITPDKQYNISEIYRDFINKKE